MALYAKHQQYLVLALIIGAVLYYLLQNSPLVN